MLLVFSPGIFGMAPEPDRQAALMDLVRDDCGACHGMTLKGGLGPSLLPDALRIKSDAYLVSTIQDGHPGTPMPPWKTFLTVSETEWLIRVLKEGMPNP